MGGEGGGGREGDREREGGGGDREREGGREGEGMLKRHYSLKTF